MRQKNRLIIGIILGFFIVYLILPNKNNLKFEDLALGENNAPYYSKLNGVSIHCTGLNDLEDCVSGYKVNGVAMDPVIWLGNSQLHAINQYKDNDSTASQELHIKLKKNNQYLITFSQPNSNLQEHYLLFNHLLNELPIKLLILPIVFDDLREDGIRDNLLNAINNQKSQIELKMSQTGKNIIKIFENKISENDLDSSYKTFQDRSESFLNKNLEKIWPIWEKRGELRANIFHKIYLFRNTLFGINPSTIRRIIPDNYDKNLKALEDIYNLSKKNDIQILSYIVPLRNDVKVPYDINDYQKFINEVELLSSSYNNIYFYNLDHIVPGKYWGTKSSTNLTGENELDFMHFTSEGHKILAEQIHKLINLNLKFL